MEAISNVIGKVQRAQGLGQRGDITLKEQELRTFKFSGQLDYAEFEELLKMYAQEIILDRSVVKPFVIDSNNKPNRWKRIRKKIQIRFLRPWSNLILKPLVSANNNKGSELMCVMEFCSEKSVKNSITVIGRTQ